jgi:pimeloyl-ACP methyl ester carboxylesterase
VLRVLGPISERAVAEFDGAYADLRERLGLGDGPVGLVGGSLGAAVAQRVLLEGPVPVAAAVLVSPVVQLRQMVDAQSRMFNMSYAWSDGSSAVAGRLDFVARAAEFAARGEPPVLVIVGGDDERDAFLEPARGLCEALAARYADPAAVRLTEIPGMGHGLAEEPGMAPAPQTPAAAEVDGHAVAWFNRYLAGPPPR